MKAGTTQSKEQGITLLYWMAAMRLSVTVYSAPWAVSLLTLQRIAARGTWSRSVEE